MKTLTWVLARYAPQSKYYEYLAKDGVSVTSYESKALSFTTFAETEQYKKDSVTPLNLERPFYIISLNRTHTDILFG